MTVEFGEYASVTTILMEQPVPEEMLPLEEGDLPEGSEE